MILGSKIIGAILLIGLLTGMSPSTDTLWSRKVMNCQNSECSIDTITWLSNQETSNEQGHKVELTKHFCKKPEHWARVLRSMAMKDGRHNMLFKDQVMAGNCFEISFPKKAVIFEIVEEGDGWFVRRAQWLYDQPEEMYQGYLK
jgi:hypothetical protein